MSMSQQVLVLEGFKVRWAGQQSDSTCLAS
jgi:hypothetical protein